MYLKNTWYVACTPDEIAGKPLGRQICGERLVLFRGPDGQAAALEDFCPHRGAPLSLGAMRDGHLVCGYHGLTMGADGRCVSMPGQRVAVIPAIRRFPVVERYGFVWIWPGDAELADPARLHHLAWAEDPEWAYGGGLYHVQCDYRLMIDNLMDLTHETYVHASSIGQPEIEEAAPSTRVDGDEVTTSRFMENIQPPPFWQAALRGNGLADDVPCDRWQICRFTPPSHVLIEVGVAHAGHGGYHAPPEHKASSIVVDFITPESDTSIWYFWGMARHFKPHDAALTAAIQSGQGKIFSEDLAILEAQQRNVLAQPERRLLRLNIDAGGVHSRKIIDRLLKAEAQERATLAAARAGTPGAAQVPAATVIHPVTEA
ncbi:MAG TPA: aromatic ring-hydroxylating dioxygenase subunit alpha [Pararobbsia sp.]|jgi:vanillate O-demethylase monooxygenase subunit|nr:aromatic ring-hydroxylating dioxygenase subunit alpha [Pararobbsia sp.]